VSGKAIFHDNDGYLTLITLSSVLGIVGFLIGSELTRDIFLKFGKQIFTILLLPFIPTYAVSSEIQSVSHLDISQISGEKYVLEIDKHTFDIYYGFEGTIESSGNVLKPIIQSMSVNVEKKIDRTHV